MIFGLESLAAVTEHICSKMRRLFYFSMISRNEKAFFRHGGDICLQKSLSSFYAVGRERPILPVLPHARWSGFHFASRGVQKVVQNYARSSLVGVLSRYSLLPSSRLRLLLRRVEGNVGGVNPFLNRAPVSTRLSINQLRFPCQTSASVEELFTQFLKRILGLLAQVGVECGDQN